MGAGKRAEADAWRRFQTLCARQGGISLHPKTALIADDGGAVSHQKLMVASEAWRHGAPLWLEGAYAAAAGAYYCTGTAPQTTCDPEDLSAQEAAEIAARRALVAGNVVPERGVGLVAANFEPHAVENGAWGRLFALAYDHPGQPAFGLGANTTVVLTPGRAEVMGDEAVVALDLRTAARDLGDNGAYVVANGLLDVFVAGDAVEPQAVAAGAAALPLAHLPRVAGTEDGAVLRR